MHSVGIVSGGAESSLGEAIERGLDAFLTGELAEHVMAEAREGGVHFIGGGHYATETVRDPAARGARVRALRGSSTDLSKFPTRFSLLPTEQPIP